MTKEEKRIKSREHYLKNIDKIRELHREYNRTKGREWRIKRGLINPNSIPRIKTSKRHFLPSQRLEDNKRSKEYAIENKSILSLKKKIKYRQTVGRLDEIEELKLKLAELEEKKKLQSLSYISQTNDFNPNADPVIIPNVILQIKGTMGSYEWYRDICDKIIGGNFSTNINLSIKDRDAFWDMMQNNVTERIRHSLGRDNKANYFPGEYNSEKYKFNFEKIYNHYTSHADED